MDFLTDCSLNFLRQGHRAPPADGVHARSRRSPPSRRELVPHLPARAGLAADGTACFDAASGVRRPGDVEFTPHGPGRDYCRLLEVPHAAVQARQVTPRALLLEGACARTLVTTMHQQHANLIQKVPHTQASARRPSTYVITLGVHVCSCTQ